MNLHWFHLMPYRDLPDDFAEKYASVWVTFDPEIYDPHAGRIMYNDYLDELEFAAECGFDGICVNEHHQNGYGMMPSPNIMAATLARNTTDAAIVVMGNSIALYNPPIRVAEEIAMLDVISGGRVVSGFPVGTPMDTTFAYGVNPATLRDRYHEAHDLIIAAWKAEEPFAFNGNYNKLRYVNPIPRPYQDPHPPIWIPGGGSIDTFEWCAEMDYVYAYLSYFGYKAGKSTMDSFWQTMKDLGKEPNPFQAGFIQFVGVADTDEEAMEIYAEPTEYFFHRCFNLDPAFVDPPGYKTANTVRAGVEGMVEQAARAAKTMRKGGPKKFPFKEMVDMGYVVVGSPETVAERLTEVATSLNVGQLMLLLQFGNMNHELTKFNTRLFADKVMPEIKGIFSDEWEDRWSPKPTREAVTA